MGTEELSAEIVQALPALTPGQLKTIKAMVLALGAQRTFWRSPDSDLVTQEVLDNMGDQLLAHHAGSHQALTKDRFEHALESALNKSGIQAQLACKNNPGHDITIANVPVNLKTEAAANIKMDSIHISKWMELGKGMWDLALLRNLFLKHMEGYERIFTLRCLRKDSGLYYELVEIPKKLMLEATHCRFEIKTESKQKPQPGYGYVEGGGIQKYALYFDGGTERKLQIKKLRKDLCKVHATWTFSSSIL